MGSQSFVDAPTLYDELARAREVLLGEKHDNLDHHALQAAIVRALIERGRRPAIVLEMIDVDRQPDLDAQRSKTPRDADALAHAVAWEASGWPPFEAYRPIVQLSLDRDLPIAAGNFPTRAIKAMFAPDAAPLDATMLARLGVDRPLPTGAEDALEHDLDLSHCGMLPKEILPKMALAQRLRDAQMAEVMAMRGKLDGAVLVAGEGHARRDRGVPLYLRAHDPSVTIASIAFVEVERGVTEPAAYLRGASDPTFDFLWFTPRVDEKDPCAAMHGK